MGGLYLLLYMVIVCLLLHFADLPLDSLFTKEKSDLVYKKRASQTGGRVSQTEEFLVRAAEFLARVFKVNIGGKTEAA